MDLDVVEDWFGGGRVVLPLRVATLRARVWPKPGPVEDVGVVRFWARPLDVVGRVLPLLLPLVPGRLLVEEAAGLRSLFRPAVGSRVDEVRVGAFAVRDDGAVVEEDEVDEASLRAAVWRVEEPRESSEDSAEGFFLGAAVAAVSFRLPEETLRVVGRVGRGAGRRLGETFRCGAVEEERSDGLRRERLRASDEDIFVAVTFDCDLRGCRRVRAPGEGENWILACDFSR